MQKSNIVKYMQARGEREKFSTTVWKSIHVDIFNTKSNGTIVHGAREAQ